MDHHIFTRGELGIGGQRLWDDADGVTNAVGISHHVMSADHGSARSRRRERSHHTDQSRFTCAVGPEQTENFAGMNRETNFLHGNEVPELFLQLGDFNRVGLWGIHCLRYAQPKGSGATSSAWREEAAATPSPSCLT